MLSFIDVLPLGKLWGLLICYKFLVQKIENNLLELNENIKNIQCWYFFSSSSIPQKIHEIDTTRCSLLMQTAVFSSFKVIASPLLLLLKNICFWLIKKYELWRNKIRSIIFPTFQCTVTGVYILKFFWYSADHIFSQI